MAEWMSVSSWGRQVPLSLKANATTLLNLLRSLNKITFFISERQGERKFILLHRCLLPDLFVFVAAAELFCASIPGLLLSLMLERVVCYCNQHMDIYKKNKFHKYIKIPLEKSLSIPYATIKSNRSKN